MVSAQFNSIRVLHVLGSLNRGGIETWLMHVLRHIDREAFQIDFCCLSGEEGIYANEAKSLGCEIFTIRLTKNLLAFNREFADLLQQQQYDVVHSHVHQFSGYILRQAAKNGVPYRIAHSFTAPNEQDQPVVRRMYLGLMKKWIDQYATIGLGNSRDSMVSLFGESWQTEPNRELVYCGIDLAPFEPAVLPINVRQQFAVPTDALVIGHLGRLTPAKNHKFILEIAEVIEKTESNTWFLFVGSGPLREELELIVQKKQLERMIFTGAIDDIVPFLQSMDLFLFPSLWEGLPQSVIEAQAVGLRCLCSDVVTDEVAVVPDAVQFMSLNQSANMWAQICLSMLKMPPLNPVEAWEAVARSSFAIEHSVQKLEQIYARSVGQ